MAIPNFQRRFLTLPARSFFLLGPRGTGKSTWLRHEQPDALLVDALRPEVKNSARVRPPDLRSLKAFATEYPQAQLILFYRGHERLRMGNIWCVPVDQFFRTLRPTRRLAA